MGGSYSWLKYRALGDVAVFTIFALLGSLGGWTVQTAYFSWKPILWSIPVGLLTIAIVHANNWRDIESDKKCGIQTVAIRLGKRASARYYQLLLLLALVSAAALGQPTTTLLTLLVLIQMIPLWQTTQRATPAVSDLDGQTAQLNLTFGLLYILGIGLGPFIK
jgi:1,4-dihydroxy-2-naphthoate octaprenyltransferase